MGASKQGPGRATQFLGKPQVVSAAISVTPSCDSYLPAPCIGECSGNGVMNEWMDESMNAQPSF